MDKVTNEAQEAVLGSRKWNLSHTSMTPAEQPMLSGGEGALVLTLFVSL